LVLASLFRMGAIGVCLLTILCLLPQMVYIAFLKSIELALVVRPLGQLLNDSWLFVVVPWHWELMIVMLVGGLGECIQEWARTVLS
jgi:hypothetical protein